MNVDQWIIDADELHSVFGVLHFFHVLIVVVSSSLISGTARATWSSGLSGASGETR